MWPIHARSKDEYIRLIESLIERREVEPLGEMLRQAFEDYRQEEDFSAWCASVAYGVELPDAPDFQAQFMEKFPLSLQPVQVDWAEQLVWAGRLDDGANEARAYLHRIQRNAFDDLVHELVQDAVFRAFLILTSVYTEVGARDYSKRIIEYAMMLDIEPYWKQRYQAEYARLNEELLETGLAKLNRQWEDFFSRGENQEALIELCRRCRLPLLAKRLEVLGQDFHEVTNFKPGDEEIFQLLFQTDKGAFVLA